MGTWKRSFEARGHQEIQTPPRNAKKAHSSPSLFHKLLERLEENVCPCAGKGDGSNRTPCPGLLGGPFCQTCPWAQSPTYLSEPAGSAKKTNLPAPARNANGGL